MKAHEEVRPYYSLVLSIKHPSMDLAAVTGPLGIKPLHSWRAGEERKTPAGTRLPSVNKTSYWVARQDAVGDRSFLGGVLDLARRLEPSSDLLGQVTSTGGTITLIVHLPGGVNIGDEISASDLVRLGQLGINLGVEVFPNFDVAQLDTGVQQ